MCGATVRVTTYPTAEVRHALVAPNSRCDKAGSLLNEMMLKNSASLSGGGAICFFFHQCACMLQQLLDSVRLAQIAHLQGNITPITV